MKSYFAENVLGISRNFLSGIFAGNRKLPVKYWEAVIEFTDGEITWEDLMEDYNTNEQDA